VAQIWYATLEDVAGAADIAESALADRQIADALNAGREAVDALTHRSFAPWTGTRYFRWPQDRYQRSDVLYLGADEMLSVSEVITGVGDTDTVIESQYVQLGPAAAGAPYSEINLASGANSQFTRGLVPDRSVAVTGVFAGAPARESATAVTVTALTASSSNTTLTVSDVSGIGVGSLLRIGAERMVVTGRSWTLSDNIEPVTLAADARGTQLTVTDGGVFAPGEMLLVDAEQMLITDVAGDSLIVRRARSATVLAAHTAQTDLYVRRVLTVERAQLGTSAAAAAIGATVWLHLFPGLAHQMNKAEAQVELIQSRSGYARTAGSGENATESVGRGLVDLRKRTYKALGRKFRLPGDGGQ
jgi:hypothetical protein